MRANHWPQITNDDVLYLEFLFDHILKAIGIVKAVAMADVYGLFPYFFF